MSELVITELSISQVRHAPSLVGLVRLVSVNGHKVRVYADRLAIHDGDNLSWEQIAAIKEAIWGDVCAIEVYPFSSEVINERPTRHIWRSDDITRVVCAISAKLHETHK